MKKILKFLFVLIGILILIPVLLLATSPLWLGPAVKIGANAAVPQLTGTAFNLEKASVNPFTLHCEFGPLTLANPEGFKELNAVTLGRFNVEVDTMSTMGDVLVIEDISAEDLFVSLVKNDQGQGNFDVIGENVAKATGGDKQPATAAQPQPTTASAGEKKPLKFIIKRLCLKNFKLKKGIVTIPCPSIELKDLGKDSGGYDAQQMGMAIVKEVWASVMATGMDAVKALGDGAKKVTESAKQLEESAKQLGEEAKKLKDLGAVTGETAGKATESVKNATGATVDAAKDAAGKATDAVKDAAGALKGLFK